MVAKSNKVLLTIETTPTTFKGTPTKDMSCVDLGLKRKTKLEDQVRVPLKAHVGPMGTGEQHVKKLKNLHAMLLGHELDLDNDEDEDGKPLAKYVPKV